ncbi:ABC transporter permease subunit, partial [Helicobacter pylori]|nr:ABC transporter permease subunit [Helicobacter pylori]MWR36368.1 ABC transporter permease subunit [Helicobacter pylori]
PVWVQYLNWLGGVLRGDFGYSFLNNRPVSELIRERLGWTVFLAVITIFATWVVAIPLGIYTALRRHGFGAMLANFIGYFGLATPDFLVALLLIFAVLSAGGTSVGGLFSPQYIDAPWSWAKFTDMLSHLWIPLIVIGLDGTAGIMRQMRANMLDVLSQDYVRTARAKGQAERVVIWRHALKNALLPVVTIIGLQFGTLLGGAILTETIFSWPGIGSWGAETATRFDVPGLLGFALLSGILTVLANLVVDIIYALIDPRVRFD